MCCCADMLADIAHLDRPSPRAGGFRAPSHSGGLCGRDGRPFHRAPAIHHARRHPHG
jgi:hypothetical protein